MVSCKNTEHSLTTTIRKNNKEISHEVAQLSVFKNKMADAKRDGGYKKAVP